MSFKEWKAKHWKKLYKSLIVLGGIIIFGGLLFALRFDSLYDTVSILNLELSVQIVSIGIVCIGLIIILIGGKIYKLHGECPKCKRMPYGYNFDGSKVVRHFGQFNGVNCPHCGGIMTNWL